MQSGANNNNIIVTQKEMKGHKSPHARRSSRMAAILPLQNLTSNTLVDKLARRRYSLTKLFEIIKPLQDCASCGFTKRISKKPASRKPTVAGFSPITQKPFRAILQRVPAIIVEGMPNQEKSTLDHNTWMQISTIANALSDYVELEKIRKKAVAVLRKKGDTIIETFGQMLAVWNEIIERIVTFEDTKADVSGFNIQYAGYKILADIYLLFRKTEKAIQIYRYAVWIDIHFNKIASASKEIR